MSKKIKCPWCSKLVGISKSQNLLSHVMSKGVKCVGIGQPVSAVKAHLRHIEEWLKERKNIR